MLPEGRAKLDEVIAKIAAHAALVEKMRVVGHTDRLGGTDYNDRLALRRAQTVADYLAKGGISVPIAVASMGKREQIKACEGNKRTPELIACLQPNRRVTIDITRARE
nr:OmpA family protein [Niveibacterium umoris]